MTDLLPPALAAALDRLDVMSRKVLLGKLQGERRSKRRGRSVEFDDYREYVAGDDLRHIDWNVFARLDRFFIKVFQEEEDLSVNIVLDGSPSMHAGSPSKMLFAARVAMAIGYVGLIKNNRVSLSVMSSAASPLVRMAPVRGRRSVQLLGRFLIDHAFASRSTGGTSEGEGGAFGRRTSGAPNPGSEFAANLRLLSDTRLGKGVLVLLSDLLIPGPDGYRAGLKYVASAAAAGGLDATVMQVLSPGELDPEVEGRRTEGNARKDDDGSEATLIGDLRLSDVETGRVAEVSLTKDLIAQYKVRALRYVEDTAEFCAARGLTHILVRSDQDVAGLMMEGLRRRGVLR